MNLLTVAASLTLASRVFGSIPVVPTVVMDRQRESQSVSWVYIDIDTREPVDYVIHITPWVTKNNLLCEAIVHEYGHLVGRVHTNTGVMRPEIQWWPGCDGVMHRPKAIIKHKIPLRKSLGRS